MTMENHKLDITFSLDPEIIVFLKKRADATGSSIDDLVNEIISNEAMKIFEIKMKINVSGPNKTWTNPGWASTTNPFPGSLTSFTKYKTSSNTTNAFS